MCTTDVFGYITLSVLKAIVDVCQPAATFKYSTKCFLNVCLFLKTLKISPNNHFSKNRDSSV